METLDDMLCTKHSEPKPCSRCLLEEATSPLEAETLREQIDRAAGEASGFLARQAAAAETPLEEMAVAAARHAQPSLAGKILQRLEQVEERLEQVEKRVDRLEGELPRPGDD